MKTFKLTIEYDGTDFCGWQIQRQEFRTVQGEIEEILQRIFKQKVHVHGSGRTDSGVHALGQVAHFKIETNKTIKELFFALNASLPKDISITELKEVNAKFHSQYKAKSKTYRYLILNSKVRHPHLRRNTYHYPYPLDILLMKKEARSLVGKNDFRFFTSLESAKEKEGSPKGTIRTVKKLTIKKITNIIQIDIEADGFLYKMVRYIVGDLIKIGAGKMAPGSIKKIIKKSNTVHPRRPAPAQGLCLIKVKYPKTLLSENCNYKCDK